MKFWLLVFLCCPTLMMAQNQNTKNNFRPHWTIGLQYNSEWNDGTSGQFYNPDNFFKNKVGWGHSSTINSRFQLTPRFAFNGFATYGARNFFSSLLLRSVNAAGMVIETTDEIRVTYNVQELAIGASFKIRADSRFVFSVGHGLKNISNLEYSGKLSNSFFNGVTFVDAGTGLRQRPMFVFASIKYNFYQTKRAYLFIEPHFKIDLTNQDAFFFTERNHTFGIGIGGQVSIL